MRPRKIKCALKLKDDELVRSLEELQEHFDLEKIIGYFHDGRLATWLDDYFYADEADEVRKLSVDEPDLGKQLCDILGAEYTEVGDTETIVWRKERLDRLKQFTADPEILNHVDMIAFDQEDLEDIIREEDTDIIYLCQNKFSFPSGILRKKNVRYVGIGKNVEVTIKSKESVDFESLGIRFDNVKLDGMKNAAISLEAVRKHEKRNNTPWYQSVDFLSEYIYRLMHTTRVADTRSNNLPLVDNGKLATTHGFFFDNTIHQISPSTFRKNGLFDERTETLICELRDEKSSIAFTNVALYSEVFCGSKKRIPYSEISSVNLYNGNRYENMLYVTYSTTSHGIFCEHLGNTIAIKLFLKIAAGIKDFLLLEEDILNDSEIKIAALGNRTVGEMLHV